MNLNPMLAELSLDEDKVFDDDRLIWEIKDDGNRQLAVVNGTTARLWSRSGRDQTDNFPELEIRTRLPAVLDGEVICRNEAGKPVFNLVQHRSTRLRFIKQAIAEYPVEYEVFDILELDGKNVRGLPLLDRKELLAMNLIPTANVKSASWFKDGRALFAEMKSKGWEGVIGKNMSGIYLPGQRKWIKVKVGIDALFYIVGYTQGTGWRSDTFGALELAKFDEKGIQYVGEVGTGFDIRQIEDIHARLKAMAAVACPFTPTPKTKTPASWVVADIQVMVHFAEWTNDGKLRFPSFKGIV